MARHDPSKPITPSPSMLQAVRMDANRAPELVRDDFVNFKDLIASRHFRRAQLFVPREMLEYLQDIPA